MNTDNFTPDTITIQLTKGQQTFVSLEDADLAKLTWNAQFYKTYANGGKYIAARNGRYVNGKRLPRERMHTTILSRMIGRKLIDGECVDHKDGNPLNNTRDNLRLANKALNMQNRVKYKNSTSGYKGVSCRNGKWVTRIQADGKRLNLGAFDTPEEAHAAYCEAARKYHGEFANFG